MDNTNRVLTKHGFKARKVTPEQEAALDNMAAHPSSYPRIQTVSVLNESFAHTVYATLSGGPRWQQVYLIATDGTVARLV